MGVQQFLKSAFKSSMNIMDAEEILIAGTKVMAVIDETRSSNALGTGAKNNERELIAKFPADGYSGPLRSGMRVEARGEKWRIAADAGAVTRGLVATSILLHEPERRDE